MNCPKCQAAMETVTFEGVTVDRCTGCQGIWLDAGERRVLQDLKGAQAIDIGDATTGRKMDAITAIDCPRCQKPMIVKTDIDHHDITFECCPVCKGIYLDAGEFTDLKDYTFMDYLRHLFHKSKKKN